MVYWLRELQGEDIVLLWKIVMANWNFQSEAEKVKNPAFSLIWERKVKEMQSFNPKVLLFIFLTGRRGIKS